MCCETSGELVRACECSDRFLHVNCQLKMMQQTASHRQGCPICQSPYRNVHTSITRVSRLTRDGWMVVVWASGIVLLCGVGAYILCLWYVDDDQGVLLYFGISFIALAVLLSFLACVALRAVSCVTSRMVVKLSLRCRGGTVHVMPMTDGVAHTPTEHHGLPTADVTAQTQTEQRASSGP